jgi:hypothetical protein
MNGEIIDIQTRNLDGEQATMLIVKNHNIYEVTLTLDGNTTNRYKTSELELCYLWAQGQIRNHGYSVEYE